jgi:hypothetical protein
MQACLGPGAASVCASMCWVSIGGWRKKGGGGGYQLGCLQPSVSAEAYSPVWPRGKGGAGDCVEGDR